MLESIPAIGTAVYLGYAAVAGYAQPTSATSQEAVQVCKSASQLMRDRERSESLFGTKSQALTRLAEAVQGLCVDDNQEPVPTLAIKNVSELILALPDDLPVPDIGIDPDGAISLTWVQSRQRMFSVSVGKSERLAYAWLDGSDKGHCVVRFRFPGIPERLVSDLRSIVANDRPAVRAA